MTRPIYKPWDPSETGSMDEATWRRTVVSQVNDIRNDISENTLVTEELNKSIKPMVDAYQKVAKGFEVIGWFGSGLEWMVRKWYIVAAIAIAVKVVFFGGSWADVVKLFKDVPP